MRRYWIRFLLWLLPKRMGKKLLIQVMETDEEYGLYEEPFNSTDK